MKTTTLNDLGDRLSVAGSGADGPQRRNVDQAEPPAEDVVDPSVGVVKRRMRAGDRDPGAGQFQRWPVSGRSARILLDLAEQDG